MVKTVNMLEYLEMCEKSPNWNPGSPAPLTLSEALEAYRDRAELRDALTQANQLIASLQDELAARDHRDAMKDERPL